MRKRILFSQSIAIIVGTIIGAGVLGIPFVFAQAGFLTGSLSLLVLGLALIFLRLMLAEVSLRSEDSHQLTGYTELYLGRWAKYFQSAILIGGIYGTLLAYMIGQGEILSTLLGGTETAWSLIFYIVFSFLVIQGMDMIKRTELLLTILIFFAVLVIGAFTAPEISTAPLMNFEIKNFFVPYGVILFALAGLVSVPEVRVLLKKEHGERMMKPVVLWAGVIPMVLYFVFALLVVGVTGGETSQVATTTLGEAIGPHMLIIGNIFAFFAVATSFLTLALALQEILKLDYRISSKLSSALVVVVPLLLFAFGPRDFILILSVVGALTVGVNGLFTIWAFWKARKYGTREPEFSMPPKTTAVLSVFLVVLFIAGLVFAFI